MFTQIALRKDFLNRSNEAQRLIERVASGDVISSLKFTDVVLSGKSLIEALKKNPHVYKLQITQCHILEEKLFAEELPKLKQLIYQTNEQGLEDKVEPLSPLIASPKALSYEKRTVAPAFIEEFLQGIALPSPVSDEKRMVAIADAKDVMRADDQKSARDIFFEGVESEAAARHILATPALVAQLTSLRITILLRLVSDGDFLKTFITLYKKTLALDDLTQLAEYQKFVAAFLLNDPTVKFTVDQVIRIIAAHPEFIFHPKMLHVFYQIDFTHLGALYETQPRLAAGEVEGLLNKLLQKKMKPEKILEALLIFVKDKDLADKILHHRGFKTISAEYQGFANRLLTYIGIHHPQKVLPYLDQLSNEEKAFLTSHHCLAEALLESQKPVTLEILFYIANAHPFTLGLAIIQHPLFLQEATGVMISELGRTRYELAEWIIETEALRKKLTPEQLKEMCRDHYHLRMRIWHYHIPGTHKAGMFNWKMAHDYLTKRKLSTKSIERLPLSFLENYPDLANYVITNPDFKAFTDELSLGAKTSIAHNNFKYALRLLNFCHSLDLNAHLQIEPQFAKIFCVHVTLALKLFKSPGSKWFKFLKPESIKKIAVQHLEIATMLLLQPVFIEVTNTLSEPQILTICTHHRDFILANHAAIKMAPSKKIREMAPRILMLFPALALMETMASSPTAAADMKKEAEEKTSLYISTPFFTLTNRLHVLLDKNVNVSPAYTSNKFSRDRSFQFNQRSILEAFPSDCHTAGVCAGIELYATYCYYKYRHHPNKNFSAKLAKLNSQNPQLLTESNLIARINFFQHWYARFLNSNTEVLRQSFKAGYVEEEDLDHYIMTLLTILERAETLILITPLHALRLVREDAEHAWVGNSNTGLVLMPNYDVIQKLKEDISVSSRGEDLQLRAFVVPEALLKIPAALKKPAHLKALARLKSPDNYHRSEQPTPHKQALKNKTLLLQLHDVTIMELKADIAFRKGEIRETILLLQQAIKLRLTFPKTWDINKNKLGDAFAVLKKCLAQLNLDPNSPIAAELRFEIYLTLGRPSNEPCVSPLEFSMTLLGIGKEVFASLFYFPMLPPQFSLAEKVSQQLLDIGLIDEAKKILQQMRATHQTNAALPNDNKKADETRLALMRLSQQLADHIPPSDAQQFKEKLSLFKSAYRDAKEMKAEDAQSKLALQISNTYLETAFPKYACKWFSLVKQPPKPVTAVTSSPSVVKASTSARP